MCSHGHSVVTISAASWYQRSRDGFMSTAPPVRLTTTTQSTPPALGDRGVDIGLQRHLLAAAQALVGGDDDLGLAVGDALGEAVGREAGEHHRMDRADPRAGQHRVGRFRDHRQIDGDAVALLDVPGAQDVGHLADFVVQLAVGDVLGLRGIVALPDDRGLVAALVEMPVDAVPGDVEDAVLEPFDRDVAGREGDVLDLGGTASSSRCAWPARPRSRWGR